MDTTGKKKIIITRDGPYEVSTGIALNQIAIRANADGEAVAWDPGIVYPQADTAYCLCRCGHSRTKPFCDGTHEYCGFCGQEKLDRHSYRERAEASRGETCDLLDDPSLCVSAGFCSVGDTIWGLVETSGTPEHKALAIEQAGNCPSGRLTILDKDGRAVEPPLEKEISLIQDPLAQCRGPLWVKGGIEIEGPAGEKYEVRNRVTLCRCGESKNQPYCDGQHYECEAMQGLDEGKET